MAQETIIVKVETGKAQAKRKQSLTKVLRKDR